MNYEEFRAAWDEALLGSRVLSPGDHPEETVDVGSMDRRYRVAVGLFSGRQPAEPFLGSMELKWRWGALQSARSRTCEEDLLDELFDPRKHRRIAAEQPRLRVDVRLAGMLPLHEPMRLPPEKVWRVWVSKTAEHVNPLLPASRKNKTSAVAESCLGEPEAQVKLSPSGEPWLYGVGLAGWQAINLPRQWSDSARKPDASPQRQLEAFAKQLSEALSAWKQCLKALLPPPIPSNTRLH